MASDVLDESDPPRLRIDRSSIINQGSQRLLSYAVELDAQGGENAIGFSVRYDPSSMRLIQAAPGNNLSGAVLNVNAVQASNGRLGFAVALPAGANLTSGAHQVVVVTFIAGNVDAMNSNSVELNDQPIVREIVDANANPISATNPLEKMNWFFYDALQLFRVFE